MADLTGLSQFAIGKLVDYLINEATTTIKCKENCLAMKESLQNIKPLVDKVEAELSTNTGNLRSLVAHCCNSFLDSMANMVDMNVKVGVKFESGNCEK
jgi:hypothetical protein